VSTEEPSLSNNFIALINTMGHAILIETIKMAAYYVHHSNGASLTYNKVGRIKEGKNCYAYIQGTGLAIIINQYGLNYDTDVLRETFNYCVRHSLIKSALFYVIIQGASYLLVSSLYLRVKMLP